LSAVNVLYTRELRKRFGYSATWVPTSEVRLGDVGRLQNYEFERVATLADFGVQFDHRVGSTTSSLDYTSDHGVSFAIKASGELPPLGSGLAAADAGIVVSFGAKDAIVLQAAGCVMVSIENQLELATHILALYEQGEWDEDYVAVTEVVQAGRTTVLISSSSDGSVVFKIKGDVELGPLSLAAADVGLRVSRSRNIGTQIVADGGLTPLFKAHGVRKRWLRPVQLARRGTRPPPAAPEVAGVILDEVDYEDFA
jgi:hypothetical protein